MSLTLTYDSTLARVRAALTGLVDVGQYTLQRSTDQVRWTTIRGGELRFPTGGALNLDDYEFPADVQCFYRLRGPQVADDYARTVGAGGWGTTTSGTATTVVAGTSTDMSVSGGVGSIATTTINAVYLNGFSVGAATQRLRTKISLPVVPTGAGITLRAAVRVTDSSNYYNATVTVAVGGAATLSLTKNVAGVGSVIASAVPVGSHAAGNQWAIVIEATGTTVRAKAWNVSTSTDPGGWTLTTTDSSLTTGNLAAVGVRRETSNTNGTVTVTFDDTVAEEPRATVFTGNITPTLTAVWVKSVARPFLNQTVTPVNFPDTDRPSRTGVFPIVGRSKSIAVTDVQGSRGWTQDLLTASGDILFIQVPTAGRLSYIPSGYVVAGDTGAKRPYRGDPATSIISVPCTEVAAPGPDVVGVTYTCQGVLNDYATCTDLLAAFATCSDLLDNVGSAEDVIVQ